MKILHTADWHLGHRLLDEDRHDEFDCFLQWMIDTIKEKSVEVLIIAGDIFDTSTPSALTEKQYNDFLHQLIDTDCKHIVIVGGNHDSPQRLMVNSSLLKRFNISIVGSIGKNLEELIIPVKKSKNSHEELAICAVPFIKNSDILNAVAGESFDDLEKRYASGLQKHYHQIAKIVTSKGYSGKIPIVATGHLFVTGQSSSDSERIIHVGKLGNIDAKVFPEEFNYVALGHLHRPQKVAKNDMIRYSGSPLALSFSEYDQKKSMILLKVENGRIEIAEEIKVPEWRKLFKISGEKDEVISKLKSLNAETKKISWIEVNIKLDYYDSRLVYDLNEVIQNNQNIKIIKVTKDDLTTDNKTDSSLSLMAKNENIQALHPQEVFEILLEEKNHPENNREEVKATFQELLEDFYAKEK